MGLSEDVQRIAAAAQEFASEGEEDVLIYGGKFRLTFTGMKLKFLRRKKARLTARHCWQASGQSGGTQLKKPVTQLCRCKSG